MPEANDHDELIRLRAEFESFQRVTAINHSALQTQLGEQRAAFDLYRREHETVHRQIDADMGSLKNTRTQFMAISTTLSMVSGLIIKFLWPGK